jgi:hypothetical protein
LAVGGSVAEDEASGQEATHMITREEYFGARVAGAFELAEGEAEG